VIPHSSIPANSTPVPFHRALLEHPAFRRAEIHTRWVEQELGL
jgi:biotin carboxylase